MDKQKLRSAIKAKDGWWASIFSGPLANRLLEPICEIPWITPNLITITSMLIGFVAAICFADGSHCMLIVGAVLVQLSFVVDCMDGQLARYRQQFSKFGAWLDRISDRLKDFMYFFSLAWGFTHRYNPDFYFGFRWIGEVFEFALRHCPYEVFTLAPSFQAFVMHNWVIPSYHIWPLAMIALSSVFLIDYYVNQDMKLEPFKKASGEGRPSLLGKILQFGLSVYRSVPILRFNIGEQALIISILTAFDMVYSLMFVFASMGTFYVVYWPVAKLYGFTESKY